MEEQTQAMYYQVLGLSVEASREDVYYAYHCAKHDYSDENPDFVACFSVEERQRIAGLIEEAYHYLVKEQAKPIENPGPIEPDLPFEEEHRPNQNPANPDMGSGEILKTLREQRRLSVDRVSEITRINPEYIHALEAEDFQVLPASVFVRGYIVQITRLLGLDEKQFSDSYMERFRRQKSL